MSAGLIALSGLFAVGAIIAGVIAFALLVPGSPQPMWRLNPQAHAALLAMGPWAILLMVVVAVACALSAWGLWIRAAWGYRLALVLLAVNLVANALNAVVRGDLRTLVGLPIGAALIAYLVSPAVRAHFSTR